MKKKILPFILILSIALTFCSCGNQNEYTPSKGLEYSLSDDATYYIVTGIGSCDDSVIVIPEEHDGLPVRAIGISAFKNEDITHLILSKNIDSIAYDAVDGCSKLAFNEYSGAYYLGTAENKFFALAGISDEASDEFKIRSDTKLVVECALWEANIKSLSIPESVANIGNAAFYSCSALESVDIANGVSRIESEVFGNCKKLSSVTLPESVTRIEEQTFAYCAALEEITLTDKIEYIGEYAFSNCESLKDINFIGTTEQWNNIEKDPLWDGYTANYTIHCKDGDIKK